MASSRTPSFNGVASHTSRLVRSSREAFINLRHRSRLPTRGDKGQSARNPAAWDTRFLRLAVAVMLPLASIWLAYQFWRLLLGSGPVWSSSPAGAVDLKVFYRSVHEWFAGRPVYNSRVNAFYPPATYPMLWPFLGWLDVTAARWLWGATTIACLAWFARLITVESGASSRLERAFVVLMLLSTYPAGAAIGNGQLTVHLLPTLVAGLLLLGREPQRWSRDVLGATLVLASLAKPSVAAPFFWLVLFSVRRMRPALLVVVGYVGLTALALSFQGASITSIVRDWLAVSAAEATRGGTADLSIWLDMLGLGRWMSELSLLALVALGAWVYRHRDSDSWVLIGTVAIAARFWTHHRWYDDLLMVLPMVTLFRLIKHREATREGGTVPRLLLALTVMTLLAPGGLYLFPHPWNTVYVALQALLWLLLMVYLARVARSQRAVAAT